MQEIPVDFLADIEAINRIAAVANILEVVCKSTGMGFAAVARVTETKWIACAVKDDIQFGLVPGGELKLETTICNEIRQHHQAVIIDHVAIDERFAQHHTPLMYGFQSYISMPIVLKSGDFFGTLCAIDPRPAKLDTPETVGMFKLFAELIAFHLEAIHDLALAEAKLQEEQETAKLREQFIAILGHDLRNPLGASLNAAQVLLRLPVDEKAKKLANVVQKSSLRIKGLIDNILDFARGRLGTGLQIEKKPHECLRETINQVIAELGMIWPGQAIETTFNFTGTVYCDEPRIAQLFSNLLANAILHGEKNAAIQVEVTGQNGNLELSVSNKGDKIPEESITHLFSPFAKGKNTPDKKQGLGLGLYIANEIALAHKGKLEVNSTHELTRFTLRLYADEAQK